MERQSIHFYPWTIYSGDPPSRSHLQHNSPHRLQRLLGLFHPETHFFLPPLVPHRHTTIKRAKSLVNSCYRLAEYHFWIECFPDTNPSKSSPFFSSGNVIEPTALQSLPPPNTNHWRPQATLNFRSAVHKAEAPVRSGSGGQQQEKQAMRGLTWGRPSLLAARWCCPSLCCRTENPLGCGPATLQAQEAKSSEREELCICSERQSIRGQTSSSACRRCGKQIPQRDTESGFASQTLPWRLFTPCSLVLIQIFSPGSPGEQGRRSTRPYETAPAHRRCLWLHKQKAEK